MEIGGFALNAGYVLTNRNTGNIYIFLFLFGVNVLTVFSLFFVFFVLSLMFLLLSTFILVCKKS